MALAEVVRHIEVESNRRRIVTKRNAGWEPVVVPYIGYGSTSEAHILARVILVDPRGTQPFDVADDDAASGSDAMSGGDGNLASEPSSDPFTNFARYASEAVDQARDMVQNARGWSGSPSQTGAGVVDSALDLADGALRAAQEAQRGWRQFFTTPVGNFPVTITVGERTIKTRSDRDGYLDMTISDHALEPGWHTATIAPVRGPIVYAPIQIISPDVKFGVISDVDDTIVVTHLPRLLLAAWNSFVLHTDSRAAVPGMAEFLSAIAGAEPDAPFFYLSTGAWNTFPMLRKFIRANHMPVGSILLTDWGPTPNGFFRDGQRHKHVQIRNLMLMFPGIQWFLLGDDGQNDPLIYESVARDWPDRVRAIALRTLKPAEHLLANGTLWGLEKDYGFTRSTQSSIPLFTGGDGEALLDALAESYPDLRRERR